MQQSEAVCWLTITEAAARWGVARDALEKQVQRGRQRGYINRTLDGRPVRCLLRKEDSGWRIGVQLSEAAGMGDGTADTLPGLAVPSPTAGVAPVTELERLRAQVHALELDNAALTGRLEEARATAREATARATLVVGACLAHAAQPALPPAATERRSLWSRLISRRNG